MATKKRKRFNEGGITESEDKARGLESSKADKVGFLERLRMGNIDDEGSEAYRRFGAGRAKSDRDMASEAAAMRLVDESRASPAKESAKEDVKESAKESVVNSLLAAGAAEGMRKGSGDASVAEMYSGPRTKPIERTPPAKSKPASGKTSAYPMTKAQPTTKTYDRTGGPTADELASYRSNYSNEGRGREMTKRQQAKYELDSILPSAEQTQKGLEIAATMMGGAGVKGLYKLAKNLAGAGKGASAARTPAQQAFDRARMADRLTPAREASSSAAKSSKDIAAERARDLAEGQAKTKFTSTSKKPSKRTKKFDDAESNIEFKRGGMVSSASKRADGIATKGKTRCKMR